MGFQDTYLNMTLHKCATINGISIDQVRYKAKKLGLKKPKKEPHNKIKIDIKELKQYYKTHTLEECSKKFRLSAHQLGERLKKHGIDTKQHYAKFKRSNTNIIQDLRTKTMKECGKKHDCSFAALRTLLRKNDIPNLAKLKIKPDVNTQELLDYYHTHTQEECSKYFNRSINYIGRQLGKYGADTNIHFGDGFSSKLSDVIKNRWTSEEYRQKMIQVRAKISRVSKPQKLLYMALDELGVPYYKEYDNELADKQCIIGKYTFDCVVPRKGKKRLLIEVNGDYHHSRAEIKERDKERYEFYKKHLTNRYELKYIWEHEFLCFNKVMDRLKYWLELDNQELIQYSFKDISMHRIKSTEYKPFLTLYHYLNNPGRGGIIYGAFLHDKLIACCVFSQLIRQNIPAEYHSTRELSRVCVHPNYRKKNLCSWFISKCVKRLPSEISTIISYADTTFNHSGVIYRASNFTRVSEIRPNYWYVDKDGFVMYKKCLYNKARNLKLTEAEFATRFGYEKIIGLIKHKYVLER